MKIKFIANVFDKEDMIQRYTGDIVEVEDKRAKEIINANFAIQVKENKVEENKVEENKEKEAQVKDVEDTKTKQTKKGDSNKKK